MLILISPKRPRKIQHNGSSGHISEHFELTGNLTVTANIPTPTPNSPAGEHLYADQHPTPVPVPSPCQQSPASSEHPTTAPDFPNLFPQAPIEEEKMPAGKPSITFNAATYREIEGIGSRTEQSHLSARTARYRPMPLERGPLQQTSSTPEPSELTRNPKNK